MSLNPPRVNIEKQGTIEGSLDLQKGIVRFLNVPYGTVVERWRPAVKPEPWTGVRDATKQGPVCPQPRGEMRYSRAINTYSQFDFDDKTTVFDEKHCLNLNIFVHEDTLKAAETRSSGDAAVIVFIHGGGYRDGANAMDVYDGSNLVRQAQKIGRPVIVVVLNYRLNFHGNLSFPELEAELQSDPSLTSDYERAAGNWSLQDQRLAFDWVKDHIHSFGGQANNITAVGESVGAVSINYHMLIPQHRGLFQRAIMQSCSLNSAPAIRSKVEGKLYFDFLVEHFNIPNDLSSKEKIERLKQIPGYELGLAAESPKLRMFTPYIDGVIVPEDVRVWVHKTDLYDHGVKAVMVGDVKDEGSLFGASLGCDTVEGWARVTEKYCPPDDESRKKWEDLYGAIKTGQDALEASIKVVKDSLFIFPDYSTLRALSKRKDLKKSPSQDEGFELFQYYFDRSIAAVDAKGVNLGAHHGIDLVFLFGPDFAIENVFTEEERQLSERFQMTWILFAHGETSDPHFPARITHPLDDFEYHAKEKEAIVFTAEYTVEKEYAHRNGREVLDFWEQSEKWTSETRDANGGTKEGLRSGLLCIAQPGEAAWN
ncbi:hypothetical protein BGZ79_007309 [Entomortierella chlamydospora]|nr:hypothetical protein BGZ79_007309 [Entomortierella chlamydospora]